MARTGNVKLHAVVGAGKNKSSPADVKKDWGRVTANGGRPHQTALIVIDVAWGATTAAAGARASHPRALPEVLARNVDRVNANAP